MPEKSNNPHLLRPSCLCPLYNYKVQFDKYDIREEIITILKLFVTCSLLLKQHAVCAKITSLLIWFPRETREI